jgi:hypothetical protein
MNDSKYLDSCIQILKEMRGDTTNELESKQRRALAAEIRKLCKLKKQSTIDREELKRVVAEIVEAVCKLK